jgi:hypothetical protein
VKGRSRTMGGSVGLMGQSAREGVGKTSRKAVLLAILGNNE